jgi:hypothetical protein
MKIITRLFKERLFKKYTIFRYSRFSKYEDMF